MARAQLVGRVEHCEPHHAARVDFVASRRDACGWQRSLIQPYSFTDRPGGFGRKNRPKGTDKLVPHNRRSLPMSAGEAPARPPTLTRPRPALSLAVAPRSLTRSGTGALMFPDGVVYLKIQEQQREKIGPEVQYLLSPPG